MIETHIYVYTNYTWTEIQNAHYSVDIQKRFDQTLDGGKVSWTTKGNYTKLQELIKVKIVISDSGGVKTEYACGNEFISQSSSDIYLHTLNLVELTKLLEGITICGMGVVQPLSGTKLTIYDVLSDLLSINPVRLTTQGQTYALDPLIANKLDLYISPEFKWSSKMTLWECLLAAGKTMQAIPRLIPSSASDSLWNTITFDFLDILKNNVPNLYNEATAYLDSFNEEQYCSDIETSAENLISQSDLTESLMYYPSQDGYITPRTDDIRLTTDNCKIILPTIIDRISKVYVKNIVVGAVAGESGIGYPYSGIDKIVDVGVMDITNYIFAKDNWDLLQEAYGASIIGGQYMRNNTFYWEDNILHILNNKYKESGIAIYGTPVWNKLIDNLFFNSDGTVKEFTIQKKDGTLQTGHFFYNYNFDNYGHDIDGNTIDNRQLLFHVEYVPKNSASKFKTVKTEKKSQRFTMNYNQFSEVNDTKSLGRNCFGVCQKMGVNRHNITVNFKNYSEVPEPGDYYEDYIVTNVNAKIKSMNLITAELELSKDYNILSEYVALFSNYRQWLTPNTNIVEKNMLYEDYCIIEEEAKQNTSILNCRTAPVDIDSYYGIGRYANVFQANIITNSTIDVMDTDINQSGTTRNGVIVSVDSKPINNSLVFTAKMENHLSAGSRTRNADDDGNGDIVSDVYYCNEDGTLENLRFRLGNGIAGLRTYTLPMGVGTAITGYNRVSRTMTGASTIFTHSIVTKKTSGEMLTLIYQLYNVTTIPTLIISDLLSANSPLVKQWATTKTFKVWALTKKVSKFTYSISSNATELTGSTIAVTFNSTLQNFALTINFPAYPTDGVGWALTDESGNLYLAENASPQSMTRVLQFNFRHER